MIAARCICGIDEDVCMRQQHDAQTSEPCDDRLAARRTELGITPCPDCDEPTHASESDDTGRCRACRCCYWCPAEATRTGIERDADDNARTRETCDECGESCDRAEALRKREILRNDEPNV